MLHSEARTVQWHPSIAIKHFFFTRLWTTAFKLSFHEWSTSSIQDTFKGEWIRGSLLYLHVCGYHRCFYSWSRNSSQQWSWHAVLSYLASQGVWVASWLLAGMGCDYLPVRDAYTQNPANAQNTIPKNPTHYRTTLSHQNHSIPFHTNWRNTSRESMLTSRWSGWLHNHWKLSLLP